MTTKKPREFWVDPTESDESEDCEIRQYDAFNKHPGQGDPLWQSQLIHIREVLAPAVAPEMKAVMARIEAEMLSNAHKGDGSIKGMIDVFLEVIEPVLTARDAIEDERVRDLRNVLEAVRSQMCWERDRDELSMGMASLHDAVTEALRAFDAGKGE